MKKSSFFKFVGALAIAAQSVAAFKKLMVADPALVKPNALTTQATAFNAFSCLCDITKNSCDAYCCCDPDCDASVKDFWNENYNLYCAKNTIVQKNKPSTQCIDENALSGFNKRMGMQNTTINGQTCVSLDVGSVFSTNKEEVTTYTEAQVILNPDIG